MSHRADPSPEGRAPTRLLALCTGLGTLYLAQGVVAGVGTVLVALMAAQGQSLEAQSGVLAWGALPWVLKLAWAWAWDAAAPPGARGRAWGLVALQLCVGLAALTLSDPASPSATPLAFFALNLAASWQDVGTDAFAIDATPPARRGLVNAVMAGARALGAGWLGAIVLYGALAEHGAAPTLRAYAWGLMALAVPVLGLRWAATKERSAAARTKLELGSALRAMVGDPKARFALMLASLTLLGDGLSGAVAADFLQKRAGWSVAELTGELLPLQVAAEVLAFVAWGAVVDRMGRLRAVAIAAGVLAAAWIAFGAAESVWTSHGVVKALAITEASARALLLVGAYGFLMGAADARARATHFVIYMSLLNLPRVLGPLAAPNVFDALGYAGVWLSAGALQLTVAAAAVWGQRRRYDAPAPS